MSSVLLPIVVVAVAGLVVAARVRARRRAASAKVSGGRRSLVTNLFVR